MRPRPAIFLDRDGVIVEDVGPITHKDQFKLIPGAVEGLRRIKSAYRAIIVTNQAAVGRGLMTEGQMDAVHSDLAALLQIHGASVDAIYVCPHAPEARCWCRKPKPGMLLKAKSDWNIDMPHSYMVGDRQSDMDAARAAGVRGILVGGRGHAANLMGVANMLLTGVC